MTHRCPFLKSRSRYGIRPEKKEVGGKLRTFDSKGEGRRFADLALLERAGVIRDLTHHQPKFTFILPHAATGEAITVGTYEPDYCYVVVETGESVVEDYKDGLRDAMYRMKVRLMAACHGVDVFESGPKTVGHGGRLTRPAMTQAPTLRRTASIRARCVD